MTAITADGARFEIGRVIGRSFTVIGSNPVTFIGLAILLTLPYLVFASFGIFAAGLGMHAAPMFGAPRTMSALIAGGLVGIIIYYFFNCLLQAAITHGTIVSLNGGRASFGNCFATGIHHVLPLAAISLLAALGIIVGFMLIVVPGILLGLMWTVVVPVQVAERTSVIGTFGRSSALTKGYRWQLLGLMIIYIVVSLAVTLVAAPIALLAFNPFVSFTVNGVVRVGLTLLVATGVASAYYELRMVKEGIGPEQLAAVFD